MDRFVLTPSTREITVNRAASDSADDLFSYSPDTQALARSRGHLFVVGHTDQEGGTVGYLVSLLAALAKREYFASSSEDAKGAFGQTLHKVNEVVEEFMKSGDVKIDVGIFAVAGDELLVSRLGRFRVLLARDTETIDVLKDVGAFAKEHVEKAQFSSIISGPIQDGDRLMAYFPQRAIASRERSIKQHLKADSSQKVAAHLAAIGKRTKTFTCSALVIDLAQTTLPEPEVPQEVKPDGAPEPQLAWAPRQATEPPAVVRRRSTETPRDEAPETAEEPQEVPRIIASEFTRDGRVNPIAKLTRTVRSIRLNTSGKFVAVVIAALLVVSSLWGFRSWFLTDEAAEYTRGVLSSAEASLSDVRSAIEAGDVRTARAQILGQLDMLGQLDTDALSDTDLVTSYTDLLSEVDRATPGEVTLITSVPGDDGFPVRGIAASGSDSFWAVTKRDGIAGATLLTITDSEIVSGDVLENLPDFLVAAEPRFVAIDATERIVSLHTEDDTIDSTLPTPDTLLDASWYGGNVYALTGASILKVSDVDTSKPVTKQWLTDESDLAAGAVAIAVDGDIWTLSRDGTLSQYYRGERVQQAQLPFSIEPGTHILTTQETPELQITDVPLKRVYIINKESMELVRTISIDTEQRVLDIFLAPDQASLLFITEDGKIWSLR